MPTFARTIISGVSSICRTVAAALHGEGIPPILSVFAAGAASMSLCGCRAVDVGKPSVSRNTRTVFETAPSPVRSEITAVRMTHSANGDGSVEVGLEMDVRDEFARTSHEETTTVSTQRRLAWGFFPAAAEQYCIPEGAEKPVCLKRGFPAAFLLGLPFVPLGTVHSLLLEGPFGSYDCSKGKSRNAYAHVGLVGVHKYTTTVRKGPVRGPDRQEAPQVRTRSSVPVPGPFEIEFSIPALGHHPPPRSAGKDGRASFGLPPVPRDWTARAYVSFRPARQARDPGGLVSGALAKATEQTHSFDITLHAPERPPAQQGRVPPAAVQPKLPAVPPPPVPPAPIFKFVDIKPGEGGRYLVRVEVLDQSQTLPIALRIIQPDVRQMVREDFLMRNAGVPEQHVREFLQYETEKGGRFLVFTGWAFSVRPVEDGWNYDSGSRRGWVRLRISGGMPASDAKQWARENISAIVAEKNVAIEAGKAPPPGATYKSLSERYENGILTMEFEAVE